MMEEVSQLTWQSLLPKARGTLPSGEPLFRTEASSAVRCPVLFLGVYPAATRVRSVLVDGVRRMLPMAVERTSFESSSASGGEIDASYLLPLGLSRAKAAFVDLMPYFFANTTRGKKSGRSMADNVRAWERSTGTVSGIVQRPAARELVSLASTMPGNVERLTSVVAACRPQLLITLGVEPAAFVRGEQFETTKKSSRALFYGAPERCVVLGAAVDVIHLVHPHVLMKQNRFWQQRHETWCAAEGKSLVQHLLGTHSG